MDSSSTSSPFSSRSTIPSSPENNSGDNAATVHNGLLAFPHTSGQLMQGMQAILSNLTGATSYGSFGNFGIRPPANESKPDGKPATPGPAGQAVVPASSRPSTSAAQSVAGSGHGGSRTEPPKRLFTVDGLQISTPSLDDIAAGYSTRRNMILLQGDPQVIHKQRVETAIRVIIDMLRQIPPSPSVPNPHPTLATLIPRDPSGNSLYTFERLANFRGLRLQSGTTTKTSSKKQLAQGAIPLQQLAYVETAVYMSGENGKRVYACKRCRAREERRRQNKDAARKKQVATDTDAVTPNAPRPSRHPPTEDYITGENAVQYDPHRIGQVVEEPPWDPTIPDWRHEIVLFNSPPDVAVKDGSAFWLPFRVICYCKCHGEKVGFRIKFTLRTFDGRIIASEMTHPIKITDDHKTDAKAKPRVDRFATIGGPQPARSRKGRMSTASSQRVSPAPSESEMSVTSEVGAVTQKQTPQVRQGKPYERPPSQSPAVQTSALPFDFLNQSDNQRPRLSRQASASSYVSQPDITNWTPDAVQQSTVSPDALRRPNFAGMTPMTNINTMSNPSSHAPSPSPGLNSMGGGLGVNGLGSNDMFHNDLNVSHQGGLDLSALGAAQNPLFANQQPVPQHDVDMANVATELENMLMFGRGSSHASVSSSSYQDDHSSVFSGFNNQGSIFSDSGLPPENTSLDDMIDYSGGESSSAISPMQGLNLSPTVGMGTLDLGTGPSPFQQPGSLPRVNNNPNDHDAQTRALLALLAQQQMPAQPVPVVSHVIPAEGPMAGGVPVAIAGRLFQPDTVIVFGGRPAITTYVSNSFLQCTLPPSPTPGDVEVTVQGYMKDPTVPAMLFRYTGMDKEMMRLMLEVRQRHGAADPAVQLVDHLARSNQNSDISDRSSMSPGGNASPFDAAHAPPADQAATGSNEDQLNAAPTSPPGPNDLQTTLVTFLESLEVSPGSLRTSGVVNLRNEARQTLVHLATAMGFSRLLRRLIVAGAELDLQDVNGFTPLALAALCGYTAGARILLESGAAYDVPTVFGEMPLDLAKVDDENEVEGLLLAAVWSTNPDVPIIESDYELSPESESDLSEIDNDNPSSSESESDEGLMDVDSVSNVSRALRSRRSGRRNGKQRSLDVRKESPPNKSRRTSPKESPENSAFQSIPLDDPPPYAPPEAGSWMSRTLSNISHPISDTINGAIPTFLTNWEKHQQQHPATNWVAFPAPSWDSLQKLTSPEEVKLFTQAMAAAAFNAVVQSGATTSHLQESAMSPSPVKVKHRRKRRASEDSRSSGQLSNSVVEQVKQDRMLYLFWLPVLLFVGFWLLVTALPIATGFCLIYARQIGRAIKQRL